jgi:hypothetical protein
MHIIICISFFVSHSMHITICISFYAYHDMHLHLCISLYASHFMHIIQNILLCASYSIQLILCIQIFASNCLDHIRCILSDAFHNIYFLVGAGLFELFVSTKQLIITNGKSNIRSSICICITVTAWNFGLNPLTDHLSLIVSVPQNAGDGRKDYGISVGG